MKVEERKPSNHPLEPGGNENQIRPHGRRNVDHEHGFGSSPGKSSSFPSLPLISVARWKTTTFPRGVVGLCRGFVLFPAGGAIEMDEGC